MSLIPTHPKHKPTTYFLMHPSQESLSTGTMSSLDARKNFSELIGKASFANEPTIITRSGKNVAVVISFEDYERYRQLEDQADGELAMKRLAAGGKRHSLADVKAELGL